MAERALLASQIALALQEPDDGSYQGQ